MKRLKRIMALVIAMAMVVAMAMPAMAEDTTGAPTKGSITVNSPIVEATYKIYKVFDMTTNKAEDAFSYTIDTTNDFYGAVVKYASDTNKGLILSRIEGSNPATYNVSVDESKFNAQDFGKAMQAVLTTGSPVVAADAAYAANPNKGIAPKPAGTGPIAEKASKKCTITDDNTSDQLVFENVDLGYYLINPTYPAAAAKTATMGEGSNAKTFTEADLVTETVAGVTKIKEPKELNPAAKTKVSDYVKSVIGADKDDAKFEKYLEDNGITTNPNGSPLDDDGKQGYYDELKGKMEDDATKKILDVFNNPNGEESDINVKEPILVFLDSSKPDAVINEKNELDKWDVPVNPSAGVQPGQPDHGEPEGGKNIVVQEDPQYFADWSEANIGESVHYQLRVNAMNFIRTGETDATIEQVKEYFLADYQSGHMEFDESKGLKVTVWQGDNDNDSQATTKANVTKDATGASVTELDYTSKKDTFFKNNSNDDLATVPNADPGIFGDGTGIMVPWVKVVDPKADNLTEAELNALKADFPIYTITNVPVPNEYVTEEFKRDGDGRLVQYMVTDEENGGWKPVEGRYVSVSNHVVDENGRLLDENDQPIQKTNPVYTFSLYNSDVTIVVDYWMILKDNAVVDDPGNKNYAQYGWSPVDNEDDQHNPKKPENPKDTDKPSQKEKIDEATVYTFALAWVKIDKQGKELADAEFELPFYVKKVKDGKAYVYGVSKADYDKLNATEKAKYTNKVTTTTNDGDGEKGVITIKGVEQGEYSITETQAPAGFNKLTAPFTVKAKKSGPEVKTTTKTTIYYDAQGNVTDEVTNISTEYKTDVDSFNKVGAPTGEEESVPVFEYKHVVNEQGTELPSTGGIGTTIFYVVGAILVIGAGVILITRRRMDA